MASLPRALASLFPSPKRVRLEKGVCPFGRDRGFRADLPKERRLREHFAQWEQRRARALGLPVLKTGPRLTVELGRREVQPEGFLLDIAPRGVQIAARDAAGAFYGMATLAQIVRLNGEGALPCARIEDFPDNPSRGFLLDVSRCKVPTLDALCALTEQLARLRVNVLQLYVEHTFAFKGGETAWADASPLTPDDIQALENACRRHFIDFVPHLNGFGHMDRWLRHPEFKSLAESPEGFTHPVSGEKIPYGGTLSPNAESLAFVGRLYDDYLPRFASTYFNAGCDEPWELGKGKSAAACAEKGKHAVYLDYVAALQRTVAEKFGKRMEFWADVLLESPQEAARLPRDCVPVLWGYDDAHPIDAQASILAQTGLEFLIAPGCSTWLTFSGRWENARPNIDACVEAARTRGAAGLLLTAWGDRGNLQPWPLFYLPLAYAAARMWNADAAPDDAVLAREIDAVFGDGAEGLGEALLALGVCEADLPKAFNRSRLYEAALAEPEALDALARTLPPETLCHAEAALRAVKTRLAAPKLATVLWARELRWGVDANLWALSRLAAARVGKKDETLYPRLRRLVGELETLWLARARIGGLYEAQAPLRARLADVR